MTLVSNPKILVSKVASYFSYLLLDPLQPGNAIEFNFKVELLLLKIPLKLILLSPIKSSFTNSYYFTL